MRAPSMPTPHPISRLALWLSIGVAVSGILASVLIPFFANAPGPERPSPPSSARGAPGSSQRTGVPATSSILSAGTGSASSLYFEVTGSCGPYFEGAPCLNMRSGPGMSYPVIRQLRDGIVLKIAGSATTTDGQTWYQVGFDGEIHYPERISGPWYVAAQYVHPFLDRGLVAYPPGAGAEATTAKHIVVSTSRQMLYAYDGSTLFMQTPISTGLSGTPTPLGQFHVFRKMPDSYMQGPIPGVSSQYYDLPGVPWDLYFTTEGAAIHGAYWHNHFGEKWSHGCVNLPIDASKTLYEWTPLGTLVSVVP